MSSLTHLDLQNTFGALFIGGTFAAILLGVSIVQAFIYFQAHRGPWMSFSSSIVIGLLILNTLHVAVMVHCIYYYLVTNYTDISALTEIVWSFKCQILIDVLIIYVVHLSYVYRIWIVSEGRSRVLPMIVGMIVTLASGGVSIALLCALYRCHVYSDLIGIEWASFTASGTFAFVDFVIASSMCYFLANSRTGFASTGSFLTSLVTIAIRAGCLMSVFSIVTLVTCVVMPRNFIFLGIELVMTKLYINSFLTLLNARPNSSKKDSVDGPRLHIRHSVYPPQLHREFEDGECFRKDVFNHPDDEDPTHPIQVTCHNLSSV